MYASEVSSGPGIVFFIFYFAFVAFMIIVMWKIFVKAGKPGWGCIVPIYNIILQLEIAGRPLWWIFLMFIPIVNFIIAIIITLDIAKAFGKGTGFGVGMILLPIIFYPILAFDSSEYQETVHIVS
ncbi:MAG: signal peptidase I [Candidatus Cloacimonetes bacterium]|nr:signal peptidase I [Candidatus Cloacimonadota bacterium]